MTEKQIKIKTFLSDAKTRKLLNSLLTSDLKQNYDSLCELMCHLENYRFDSGDCLSRNEYYEYWNNILKMIYDFVPDFFAFFDKIPSYLFANTTFLNELIIPSSVKIIGDNAFKNSSLTKVTILSTVEELGYSTFKDCKNLKEIDLPRFSKFKTIPSSFAERTAIEKIAIPTNVEKILDSAFLCCNNLSSIIISTRGEALYCSESAFSWCPISFIKFYGSIKDFSVYCAPRYGWEWHPDMKRRYKNRRFCVGYGYNTIYSIGLNAKPGEKWPKDATIICSDGTTTFYELREQAAREIHNPKDKTSMYHKK